jgi:penicillin amidase
MRPTLSRVTPLLAAASLAALGCSSPASTSVLRDDVDVITDNMGIPHVYASSDADAFYGAGYAMARMRLFQLEMLRRQALGTAAEVLGEQAVRGDLLARTLNLSEYGKQSRTAVQQDYPDEAEVIENFVRGINAYIDRVNAGLAPLPAEMAANVLNFQPTRWTQDDPYIIGKLLSFGMSSSLDSELLATALPAVATSFPKDFPLCTPTRNAFTMPDQDEIMAAASPPRSRRPERRVPRPKAPAQPWQLASAARLLRYQPLSPQLGSNNWAVAGRYTDSGHSIVCGDPHQPLGSPSRFFAQHLSTADRGGSLDVIGFGFAGTPGVQLGHNRTLAWTATTNFADVMDLWEVTSTGDQVALGGAARPTRVRKEQIRVRAPMGPVVSDDNAVDVRQFAITDVPGFGVLLPDELLPVPRVVLTTRDILLNWTGFAATHEAAMYLGLDRAATLDQWEQSAQRLEVGAVNLVAADKDSIRYKVHARVPDRGKLTPGYKPWMMMNGADPATLWNGHYLSDDKLPSARDPARGYLTTANNDPFGFTKDGRVDNDPYYYGYFYDPGDRAARIESELRRLIARGKITPADMSTLQGDARSTIADELLPQLAAAMTAIGTDPALQQYRNRPELPALFGQLSTWDHQMRRPSAEAVAFFAFVHFATERALSDDLGVMLPALFQADPQFAIKPLRMALRGDPAATPLLQEGKNVILVGALADAADWLKSRFGTVLPTADKPYAWKDVHGAEFDHILGGSWNGGVVPVDGSVGTVNVSSASMLDGSGKPRPSWTSQAGALYRMVTSFDDSGAPRALVNYTRGNDENPESPYYNNAQPGWVDNQPVQLWFRRADVDQNTAHKLTIHRDGSIQE